MEDYQDGAAMENDDDRSNVSLCSGEVRVTGHVNAAVVLVLFPIGLLWNSLVIAIVLKKKLFIRPSNMLMLSLAIANLLVCFFLMIPTFALGVLVGFRTTPSMMATVDRICQIGVFLPLLAFNNSCTVALMAVDRAIYLKKPLTYDQIVTPRRMLFMIAAVWIVCIAIAILPLFKLGEIGFYQAIASCSLIIEDKVFFYVIIALAGLMNLIQIVGCGIIIYSIRKHLLMKLRQKITFVNSVKDSYRPDLLKDYNKTQLQLLKVFGVIFSISVLTYLPMVGQGIVLMLSFNLCNVFIKAIFIFILFRSVIHPIVESFMTNEIRDVLSKILHCGKGKCKCTC